jgi:hypothetical protein
MDPDQVMSVPDDLSIQNGAHVRCGNWALHQSVRVCLMSYAVGGVGISHADVGDLEEGILYDELCAAGHCAPPIANEDLLPAS